MSIAVGLLSRIMVRKMSRRATADGKQTVPVLVKVSDGEGTDIIDDADMTAVAAEADAAREQFPFIFNLLRGHAVSSAQPGLGQVGVDSRRSKTSPHHHHQQQQHQQLQLQQQQQVRKPAAVAACRQHQATPPARGTHTHTCSLSLAACF